MRSRPARSLSHCRSARAFLSPVNPFLKMGLAFVLMVLALSLREIWAMGAIAVGSLLLLAQFRLRPLLLLYGLLSLTVFALSAAWLLADWPKALFSTLRLVAILLPTPVLALSTPPADLIRALQALRLPSFLSLSLMLIWRFFPLIQQELQRIWEANQLRGIDLRHRPGQWFSGLMVPLVFQMVTYADEVTIGLQTRGYSPTEPRSNHKPMRWRWLDTLFAIAAIGWIALVVYLEWGDGKF